MYVYRKWIGHSTVYEVGYFYPDDRAEFQVESQHATSAEAAARVSYLNGGVKAGHLEELVDTTAKIEVHMRGMRS